MTRCDVYTASAEKTENAPCIGVDSRVVLERSESVPFAVNVNDVSKPSGHQRAGFVKSAHARCINGQVRQEGGNINSLDEPKHSRLQVMTVSARHERRQSVVYVSARSRGALNLQPLFRLAACVSLSSSSCSRTRGWASSRIRAHRTAQRKVRD